MHEEGGGGKCRFGSLGDCTVVDSFPFVVDFHRPRGKVNFPPLPFWEPLAYVYRSCYSCEYNWFSLMRRLEPVWGVVGSVGPWV